MQARYLNSGQNVNFQLCNLYPAEIVNLSRKPKISWFHFLVDLKAQSKHRERNCPVRMFTKVLRYKKCLNMNFKPDKECERL